jgi:hypothetical protein
MSIVERRNFEMKKLISNLKCLNMECLIMADALFLIDWKLINIPEKTFVPT